MPTATVKLSSFELDKGRYSRTLDQAIMQQMRMAARAFLSAAVRAVPVRTGFARGSLRNLQEATSGVQGGPTIDVSTPAGQFLKAAQLLRNTPFRHSAEAKKSGLYSFTRHGLQKAGAVGPLEYYRDGKRRILKTPQAGREFATQPSQIFREDGFVYTFNFEVFISYYNINDAFTNSKTPGTPWDSFRAGRATFLNYLKTMGFERLPQIGGFIMESVVSVEGTSFKKSASGYLNRNSRFNF